MPLSNVYAVTLIRHPENHDRAICNVDVRVRRQVDGMLTVAYVIVGDLRCVRVPQQQPPRITHGLWQHTCCECFIALPGDRGYHELNLAPSGEWAAYAFSKYRERAPFEDEALNPRIVVHSGDNKVEINASIPLERLSAAHVRERLAIGLSTVIEDEQGILSYWALMHPSGKPDFHHRESFVLELESL